MCGSGFLDFGFSPRLRWSLRRLGGVHLGAPAYAQAAPAASPSAKQTTAPQQSQPDRLFVDAQQLVYNKDTDVVSAEGNVQLYYQGRVLEADKVIYNRKTSRVFAEGHAKLTAADGSVTYGDRFDLTDDFKAGFIDSLSTVSKDKTRMTAPRAERSEGETSVLDKATYTACEPCKEHPERPVLWQVRAMRIIHKADEQMIYFEDAYLELFGMPIAYFPYLSSPDPTVTRKTGVLAPRFVFNSALGSGVSVPYFINLAPNMDLTLTPTVLSNQGFLGQAEFRQRLLNGSYSIRASGIYQLDPSAFAASPYGTGNRQWRGSIESEGKFYINKNWTYGWNVALFSDKYFFQDYKVRSDTFSSDYIRESVSTAYLTGIGDRSYFDLRGYRIEGLSAFDFNKQQPLVLPVMDYNRTIAVDPDRSFGLGGEVNIDMNFTALTRQAADYQSTGVRLLDKAFSLYDVCPTSATPNPALPNFKPPSCFIRGIAGDYERASAQITLAAQDHRPHRRGLDPVRFCAVRCGRVEPEHERQLHLQLVGRDVGDRQRRPKQLFRAEQRRVSIGRAMPGVGIDWRYPFVAQTGSVTHTFEPIAQVIARPNETEVGHRPNEDAQSLFFDDTNLFEWNKFSGYDRVEGGVRANVGGEYTTTFQKGGYANAMFGQSIQLAGINSFAASDVANVTADSGLEKQASDYVARLAFAPNANMSFLAKTRFDRTTFEPETLDLISTFNWKDLTSSIQYSRYACATADRLSVSTRRRTHQRAL